jgi:hypothetical protein
LLKDRQRCCLLVCFSVFDQGGLVLSPASCGFSTRDFPAVLVEVVVGAFVCGSGCSN